MTATLVGSFFAPGRALADGGYRLAKYYSSDVKRPSPDQPEQLGEGYKTAPELLTLKVPFDKYNPSGKERLPMFSVDFSLSGTSMPLNPVLKVYTAYIYKDGTVIQDPSTNKVWRERYGISQGKIDVASDLFTGAHQSYSTIDNPIYVYTRVYLGDTGGFSGLSSPVAKSPLKVATDANGDPYPIIIEKDVDYRQPSLIEVGRAEVVAVGGDGDLRVVIPATLFSGGNSDRILVKRYLVTSSGPEYQGEFMETPLEGDGALQIRDGVGVGVGSITAGHKYLYILYTKLLGEGSYRFPLSVYVEATDGYIAEIIDPALSSVYLPKIELPGLTGEIFNPLDPITKKGQLGSLVARIINWAVAIAGLLAIIFIIISGYQYMVSAGDPGQAKNAMGNLTFAIIGLVVVLVAYLIINTIVTGILNINIENDYIPQVEEINNANNNAGV